MSRALAKDKQRPLGAYYTPDDVALQCLRASSPPYPPGDVLEPSVGGGAFARAATKVWGRPHIKGLDIDPRAPGFEDCEWVRVIDWLDYSDLPEPDAIIGNPPFSDAERHIRKALEWRPVFVGFLLRLAFLESVKRVPFWQQHRPHEVHVLAKRPSFTGGGTDSAAYGWFVWRPREEPPATPTAIELDTKRRWVNMDWIWPELPDHRDIP